MFAEVDVLLDLAQFRQMVPDTTATHMDTNALILYHSAVIAVKDILNFAEPPQILIQWASPIFTRMTGDNNLSITSSVESKGGRQASGDVTHYFVFR